ncbi:potassium channel subfamily K member 13-like [Stegodyphus dumicola]|uniref:potassium channel subfamily K member 13-like n=1 Tax=Stegodyphus dumicola TaxID=202533 RepID=UPI0015AE8CD6|nr:potassium channel subfamily K member 13-like [Stegodyphus dumicola]
MHEDRRCKKTLLAKAIETKPDGRPPVRWIGCVENDLNILKDEWAQGRALLVAGMRNNKLSVLCDYFVGNLDMAEETVFQTVLGEFHSFFFFFFSFLTGFGMTTPKTLAGRIVVIFYGFLGCSGAILFFNLFLERIITFLAYILRLLHERELRKRGLDRRRDSQLSFDDTYDWKPSVYWVMLSLFIATISIAVTASFLYGPMEGWSYFDCLYFCFVTFSTIGFGDYVTSQEAQYPHVSLYRLANFVFIVCGCCCIYSLFNVTSIVIKQILNWVMKKLDVNCVPRKPPAKAQLLARGRRNAITPFHFKKQARGDMNKVGDSSDVDSNYDSEGDCRNSGEMVITGIKSNKFTLAVMQKQLHESAQRDKGRQGDTIVLPSLRAVEESTFKPGSVGPLAIVSKKLGEDDI